MCVCVGVCVCSFVGVGVCVRVSVCPGLSILVCDMLYNVYVYACVCVGMGRCV